ncbi:hypothetical protein [Arenibacter echinorum]|uniref:Ferric oxidoreductase domain-containing protein n=1 Tax=Arenibacter echinorum TaxID=440515 RepID=A0A327QZA3_9FLAO|nr:hypothetical protein [Arenibacter echinorum]RAJ09959.1 hypothetical protein LV92_02705 [Arenibacter echinorum]
MEEGVQRKYLKTIWTVLIISLGYAVLRYNVVGTVEWKDLPIFILNKGVSLAAIVLLTFSFTIRPLLNLGIPAFYFGLEGRKILGISGLLLTIFHVGLSFLIFNPQYYPKFFDSDNSLSVIGNFSLLAGMASFMILGLYHWCFRNRSKNKEMLINIITSKEFLLGLLFILGIHLVFMGYSTWSSPSKWQGGLPPISLISFVVVLFGFVINGFARTSVRKV